MHLKTLVDIFCGNWGKAPCKSCDSAVVMNLSVSFISSYFPGNPSILNVHQRLLFRRGFRRIHSTNLLKYQSRNNLCCYYARCKNRIVDFLVFAAFVQRGAQKRPLVATNLDFCRNIRKIIPQKCLWLFSKRLLPKMCLQEYQRSPVSNVRRKKP